MSNFACKPGNKTPIPLPNASCLQLGHGCLQKANSYIEDAISDGEVAFARRGTPRQDLGDVDPGLEDEPVVSGVRAVEVSGVERPPTGPPSPHRHLDEATALEEGAVHAGLAGALALHAVDPDQLVVQPAKTRHPDWTLEASPSSRSE